MTNKPKSPVSKPRSVQEACQSARSAVLMTALDARKRALRDALIARCCYCGGHACLRFVEAAPVALTMSNGMRLEHWRGADELPADEVFIFQWMCAACRQLELPF